MSDADIVISKASRWRGVCVWGATLLVLLSLVYVLLGFPPLPENIRYVFWFVFIPFLNPVVFTRQYDIEISDGFVSGRSSSWVDLRRVTIPINNIDVERTLKKGLLDRLTRTEVIVSREGKKIVIDGFMHNKEQRQKILQYLKIGG